jgi:hypothetical protein
MVRVPSPEIDGRRRCGLSGRALGLLIVFLTSFLPDAFAAGDPAQQWALAAEQGNAAALAHLYAAIDEHDRSAENWYGVYCLNRGDDVGAQRWFAAAAQHGDAAAQYNLANLYANGLLSPRGATQAVEWYRKAAEQGYAPAERSLGEHYLDGIGVTRDPALGQRWLQRAAAAGERVAALTGPAASASQAARPDAGAASSTAALTAASTAASARVASPSSAAVRSASATAVPATRAAAQAPQAAVDAALRAWADAWSRKDLASYFGAYLPNYAPPGIDHAAWMRQRRSRIADKASITVSLTQLRTRVDGDSATASFIEHFRAGALQFVGPKTLRLQRLDGRWLIDGES